MAEYVCPKHPDVVLFTDEDGARREIIKSVTFSGGGTRYCGKCDKHYYKHECDER